MATTPPKDEQQPRGRSRRKPAPGPAAGQPDEQAAEAVDEAAEAAPGAAAGDEPSAAEIARGARNFKRLMAHLSQGEKEPREDVSRNRAKIRRVMVDFIKNELRSPTVQELVELTGLSDKTVKAHKKHIKLGDGKANVYQDLTPDVMMSLYKKAKGFTFTAERLLTVSQGQGCGSEVERHEVLMYVQPDTAAAKLWLAVVEGHSDTTKTEHSGSVATGGGGFYFEYVVPEAPKND